MKIKFNASLVIGYFVFVKIKKVGTKGIILEDEEEIISALFSVSD